MHCLRFTVTFGGCILSVWKETIDVRQSGIRLFPDHRRKCLENDKLNIFEPIRSWNLAHQTRSQLSALTNRQLPIWASSATKFHRLQRLQAAGSGTRNLVKFTSSRILPNDFNGILLPPLDQQETPVRFETGGRFRCWTDVWSTRRPGDAQSGKMRVVPA